MLAAQGEPVSELAFEAGSFSVLTGTLNRGRQGGDSAPACATNSSEQDDFAEEVPIPSEGGGESKDREST